ncbi:NF-kappa-B inhibitor-like protein 1 [Spea bombifrons]|uniref:NF-kappa-B inhibitor-like protein 1 n=1 Tax=Spea bombifrons TaxID=233779 RepID=UPI002349AF83|nr:NF-kappa-B inhibitor-like protein 1 [Spea bombifrons]
MSFRRELRALRYVQRGDVLRLKSYIRRHRHLRLDEPISDGQSLLHAACTARGEACALLLLRKGADPLKCDAAGNNALHVAAKEAERGELTAYTDLVVPILRRCPQALDAPNRHGTTPRDILRRVEELMDLNSQKDQKSPKDLNSTESSEWRWKLLAESMDEYQEAFGQYEDDFSEEPPEVETFESWADRIFREYHAKASRSQGTVLQVQQTKAKATQRNVEEQKYQERQQQREKELSRAQNERYQRRCQEVFERKAGDGQMVGPGKEENKASRRPVDPETGVRLLGYNDIPWPVPGGTAEQMAQALAAGADSSDPEAYKRYLRTQRVTWHPDRFFQRCGARLCLEDRERVLRTVTALSQELNRLAERAK